MAADPVFFRDLAYVFLAALLGGGIAWLTRQPLILGYVVGGILISPLTPGPSVERVHTFELFAEIGVILLMFSIGIEFSLRDLLRVKWVALIGGPLGIVLSVALALGAGSVLGWTPLFGLTIGIVVSVASTMVLARLLMDRGELHAQHGRVMIGIALVEDLAVVVLTVLIPALGSLEPGRLLTIGAALGKALAILLPVGYVATKLVPPLMTRVARTRNAELFLLVTLGVGLGTAALSQALGLSLALGAFLAGLVISESDYAHESLARLLPLRDAFVALFFVTIGALIDPRTLFDHLPLLGVMVGLIVVGKLVTRTVVTLLFGYGIWTALLVGIGLTQIGEFSFILVQAARTAGHVGEDVYNATLAASLLTILVNAGLVRYAPAWIARLRLSRDTRQLPHGAAEPDRLSGHVILMGFGRVGSAVGEALETFGVPYLVIETDPDVVTGLRGRGIPALFGDGAQQRLIEVAGGARAQLAVVTIPDGERAQLAVSALKSVNPRLPILARAHGATVAEQLEQKGASRVIRPELEGAAALIEDALARLALPQERLHAYVDRFRRAMELPEGQIVAERDQLPQVREIAIGTGEIADQSLRDARVRERFGVTVLTVSRADGGELVLNPPPETILRPGDRVRLFGLADQIRAFVESAQGGDDQAR
ncbi:MAG: cation:proton antiporter [Candidatus Rokubacteria bacterium]|nr:cation:proton antiporter [Candidatus Rokubacteria bacterium]